MISRYNEAEIVTRAFTGYISSGTPHNVALISTSDINRWVKNPVLIKRIQFEIQLSNTTGNYSFRRAKLGLESDGFNLNMQGDLSSITFSGNPAITAEYSKKIILPIRSLELANLSLDTGEIYLEWLSDDITLDMYIAFASLFDNARIDYSLVFTYCNIKA